MWFSTDTFQIPSRELPEQSRKSKGIRRDVESREQRNGNRDRFIVVEEKKARLAHFLLTEMSQRKGTHPGRELVVSGGFILNVYGRPMRPERESAGAVFGP